MQSKYNEKLIIDGQQRIISILLIIKAMFVQFLKLGNSDLSTKINGYINVNYNSENLKNGKNLEVILKNKIHKFDDETFKNSSFYINYEYVKQYFIATIFIYSEID